MPRDIDIIHHLGLITRDMNATVARYERLGFTFTPLSVPQIPLTPGGKPESLGVGNRCAIFENDYLEMLGILDPTRWASITREQRGPYDIDPPLARYEGLHVLHLATDDLEHTRIRLVERGLQPSPIRPFQRMVETKSGPRQMRAKTLSFAPGSNPEALLQIAQHETPELVLQPRYMQHPNGALSITEVIVCVDNPADVTARYEAYSGMAARNGVIDLGRSRVIIIDPHGLEGLMPGETPPTLPFLAGFTVSADLARAAEVLKQAGIAMRQVGERLMVSARDACGAAILFEPPGATR
jgi:hypothetical protein